MKILDAFSSAFKNTVMKLFTEPSYGRTTLPDITGLNATYVYDEYASEAGRTDSLALYDEMDNESPTFSDALDSLSDLIIQGDDVQMTGFKTVTAPNAKNIVKPKGDEVYQIGYSLDATVPATEAKRIEEIIKAFEERTEIKYKLKNYIRNSLKYGDYFGNIIYGETVKSKQRVIAELIDLPAYKVLIHKDEYGRLHKDHPYEIISETQNALSSNKKEPIYFTKPEIFRIQMGGTAEYEYGKSLAHSARTIYQQMKSIMSGMVVGRLTRSHQRYLYKIDTTNMAPDVALEYVNKIKKEMTKKKMIDKNGNIVYTKSPLTAEEDIFLPVKDKGTDGVELLKSDEFLKNIEDVKFFFDEFKRALKVQTFGSSDSKGSRNSLAEMDISVVRAVKSFQTLTKYSLEKLYNMELALHGIKSKVTIEMPQIASLMTIRQFEIERLKAETTKIHRESGLLSKEYLRENYLLLNDEELAKEATRDKEAEAAALKLAQAGVKTSSSNNPQGGGSARVNTGYKNKKNKTKSNAYVTPSGRNESKQTGDASEVTE